jgi:hypothetical protein
METTPLRIANHGRVGEITKETVLCSSVHMSLKALGWEGD